MMWWTSVRLALNVFLARHGLLAAFVFLLIEEAGVPIPFPGDAMMLILGVRAREGLNSLWQVIVVLEAATVLGSAFLFYFSRWAGRGFVYQYGRYLRLGPERLERGEAILKRHGAIAVFVMRLVPGLRIITAIACGVLDVPARVFMPAMTLGALSYILIYSLLGYFVGPPVVKFLDRVHLPAGLLGSLLPLAVAAAWIVQARRNYQPEELEAIALRPYSPGHRFRAGLKAGALATLVSTLVMEVVVNVFGNVAYRTPSSVLQVLAIRLPFELARDAAALFLLVAIPVYFGIGLAWGGIYGVWVEPRLNMPDWAKGLTLGLLALAVAAVVEVPLLFRGALGVALARVFPAGEVLRHLCYGLILGLTFPIFNHRKTKRPKK